MPPMSPDGLEVGAKLIKSESQPEGVDRNVKMKYVYSQLGRMHRLSIEGHVVYESCISKDKVLEYASKFGTVEVI